MLRAAAAGGDVHRWLLPVVDLPTWLETLIVGLLLYQENAYNIRLSIWWKHEKLPIFVKQSFVTTGPMALDIMTINIIPNRRERIGEGGPTTNLFPRPA